MSENKISGYMSLNLYVYEYSFCTLADIRIVHCSNVKAGMSMPVDSAVSAGLSGESGDKTRPVIISELASLDRSVGYRTDLVGMSAYIYPLCNSHVSESVSWLVAEKRPGISEDSQIIST